MIAITHSASSDCLAAMSSRAPASGPIPPVAIRYRRFAQDEPARQLLVFECAPSFSGALPGKGMALVELADGRVFFFRTSLAVMRDGPEAGSLFEELRKLPAWITDWNTTADFVGYMIGATLEFIDKDPSRIGSWNIPEWKQHAASWLAINQPMVSIQQLNVTITQGIRQLSHELAGKLGEFMGAITCCSHFFLIEVIRSLPYYYAYAERKIRGALMNQLLIENMNSTLFLIVQTGGSGE